MKADYGAIGEDAEHTDRSYGTAKNAEDPTDYFDAEGNKGDDFDANQTYYLKETPVARPDRIRKFLLAAFPILVAIFIMGGAAYFLTQDFSKLYPGRSGDRTKTPSTYHPPTDTSPSTTTSSSSSEWTGPKSSSSSSSAAMKTTGEAACEAHPKCSDLVGDCCPTSDGIMLGCCS